MRIVPKTRKEKLRTVLVIAASPFIIVVIIRYIAWTYYVSADPRSEEFILGRCLLRVIEDGACAPIAIGSALVTAVLSCLYIRHQRDLAGWGFGVLAIFGFIACTPTVLRQG
jgi:hypothetical protein